MGGGSGTSPDGAGDVEWPGGRRLAGKKLPTARASKDGSRRPCIGYLCSDERGSVDKVAARRSSGRCDRRWPKLGPATGRGGGGFGSKVSVRTLVTGRWWPMWSSFGRWLWTGVDEGAQWCWAPAWTSDGEVVRWRCSGRPARHRLLARWSRAGDWLGGDEVAALGGGHGAAARVGVGASSRAAKETGERQMEAGGVPIRRRLDGDAAAWAEQGMAQCVQRVPERTTRAANDR
jgi:hypothetical protein